MVYDISVVDHVAGEQSVPAANIAAASSRSNHDVFYNMRILFR